MADDLTRLSVDAPTDVILEHIDRDGGVIVERAIDAARVDLILDELGEYIRDTAPVGDDFAGHQTTRTGGLVPKSSEVRELIMEPLLLGTAETFLASHTEKVQLSLTQIIRLLPGQGAQELHRDRFIWGRGLPREIEPELNSIWALTDFTAENGATRVVPGSHRWDWDRVATEDEIVQAVMPKGSVLLYTGSVIHSGGQNRSAADRIAMNINFANAWLRQEENQYLSCPPELARAFSPELRALIGYTMANYGLGYFAPPTFTPGIPDTLPPEMVFMGAGGDTSELGLPAADTF
ncbi:MAG TPA: phytanoyl-CoA dioxygenase family protein [Pseudomonadales bacterium]|nr:phytanoyl-CoA dioxygenase family protein [Pseudomonadales bacterium]